MALPGWVDWTNTGVGITGLALTLGTLWQATGAREAANAARTAIRRRNVADALDETLRLAAQVKAWTACERYSEASVLLGEIIPHLAQYRTEFDQYIQSDLDKLKESESNCLLLAVEFRKDEQNLPRMPKDEILRHWVQIESALSTIHGKLRRDLYREGQ